MTLRIGGTDRPPQMGIGTTLLQTAAKVAQALSSIPERWLPICLAQQTQS